MAVYLNSGWYSVNVTDANDCQLIDSVFVDSNAGLSENQANMFGIFPNPSTEVLNVSGVAEWIKIYDSNGKLINEMSFTNLISLNMLSTGIYTIEFLTQKDSVRMRFTKLN
jgi:hypothetical protein